MLYKDAPPQETISRIKGILASLGVKTRETFYDANGLFYSCRIEIDNYGLDSLGIGANGKGMTREYALASGYAELMERLQNKFLVNEAMRHSAKIPNGTQLSFRFFPDEELQQSYLRDFFHHIHSLFPNYDTNSAERFCDMLIAPYCSWGYTDTGWGPTSKVEWLGLPFAQFTKGDHYIADVPIILARANSSTGLCAGNTPHEAILQGINEIFERYVLQRIYLDNITPPSFPPSYFEGTQIAQRLKELKSHGYIYDIKDMSLGKGFPVVGVILTNTVNGTTMFRLGADLSTEIALERCLTEIYQGRTEEEQRFIEYPIHETVDMDNNEYLRNNEYLKSLKDGTGLFPPSIFMGKPTYNFSEPVLRRSECSKEDLRNVLDFLFERGYSVLIRDNSFLGFCAYHVIIPGLSEQNHSLKDIFSEYFAPFELDIENEKGKSCESDGKQWTLYNVKAEEDCRDFVLRHFPNDDILKLAPYCTAPQNKVNKNLLLFLFAVKKRDYQDGNRHFEKLMQQRREQGLPYNEYMACIGSYICLKSNEKDDAELKAWLKHFYTEETVREVLEDFSEPECIMKNYSFPTCFDCECCPLIAECHYRDAIAFEKMIQNAQQVNPIDQTRLFELLT